MKGGGEVTGRRGGAAAGERGSPRDGRRAGLSARADRWPASLLIAAFNALDKRPAGAHRLGSEEVV